MLTSIEQQLMLYTEERIHTSQLSIKIQPEKNLSRRKAMAVKYSQEPNYNNLAKSQFSF